MGNKWDLRELPEEAAFSNFVIGNRGFFKSDGEKENSDKAAET